MFVNERERERFVIKLILKVFYMYERKFILKLKLVVNLIIIWKLD